MAALDFTASIGQVTCSATAQTLILLKAPANQRIKIKGIEVMGAGTSNTDTPLKLELFTAVSITGGTAGTAPTLAACDGDIGTTIQTTATGNYTVEPTYTTLVVPRTWGCHPQTGLVVYLPMGDEIKVKEGTYWGLRVTSPQADKMSFNVLCEE